MMKVGSISNSDHTEPLLRVTGLSKQYRAAARLSRAKFTVNAFQDVDLALFAGKNVGAGGRIRRGKIELGALRGFARAADRQEKSSWKEGIYWHWDGRR